MNRQISYAEALCEAQRQTLDADDQVIVIGLGVPDPKGIFNSTSGLQEEFGPDRVMDMPLSENAMTGVVIGAAMTGLRPVMTHQRVDFAMTAMEQIINQAAKWHYMFNGQHKVPIVVRMVVGRGWGQGPQHSQSLQSLFAHIPGLKVIMPTSAHDAKGMLISAIEDDNPVISLEHRWLYGIKDFVPEEPFRVPLGKARVMREGTDVTIVSLSYMTLEALSAAETLETRGVNAEVVDLRSLRPLDEQTILDSIKKTGRLIVADTTNKMYGASAEIAALATEKAFSSLRGAPVRIGSPEHPAPTSPALADQYYPRAPHIAAAVLEMLELPVDGLRFDPPEGRRLDQPNASFTGPF
ncbi:MAG: alpha-ketoacid dehydrogenase subunit beta [Rhodospirillaceae bacterium]|nr:alpha-ketoacid dehydrogenase subunit beta [Rhodospirillaceae bacterium]